MEDKEDVIHHEKRPGSLPLVGKCDHLLCLTLLFYICTARQFKGECEQCSNRWRNKAG